MSECKHRKTAPLAASIPSLFRKYLAVNLPFHSCITVSLPTNLVDRRFSVSLGSDPRTIKCYGQGPTSSGSNDEIGRQPVSRQRF